MSNTYDADIVGNLVVSHGKTSAFCSENHKPLFICSVCKRQIDDRVVTVMARREHLLFHMDCADEFILVIENALLKMGHNFINEGRDD